MKISKRLCRQLFMPTLLVIVTYASVPVAEATCPSWGSFQRWRWYDLAWVYNDPDFSTATQGMTDAFAAWNAVTDRGFRDILRFRRGDGASGDITIYDDDTLDPFSGVTRTFTENTNPVCAGKLEVVIGPDPSQCNGRYCFNSSMIWYATIALDNSQITQLQSDLGISLNAAVQMVMVHEIGHVADLNEETTPFPQIGCNAPTVMNTDQGVNCRLFTPQQCDSDVFWFGAYDAWSTYENCHCGSTSCS